MRSLWLSPIVGKEAFDTPSDHQDYGTLILLMTIVVLLSGEMRSLWPSPIVGKEVFDTPSDHQDYGTLILLLTIVAVGAVISDARPDFSMQSNCLQPGPKALQLLWISTRTQ